VSKNIRASIAIVILLVLAALRFVNLGADPPLFYSHQSQSLLTDPYQYTFYARNAILYSDWNPFDYHRFDVFRNSLISGLAWLSFAAFGVSNTSANLAALAANLTGILFFLLGLSGMRPRRETFFTALFILFSSHLFFYGRVPYLENGLILFSGLIFFVLMRLHNRWWGQLVAGVLIALATLSGKLFGALLLGPVILTLLYVNRRHAVRPILLALAGGAIGAMLFLLIFYGGNLPLVRSYYVEQSVGLYGGPPALGSIDTLAQFFITYGKEAGLWRFAPYFMAVTGIGFIIAVSDIDLAKPTRENLPVIFSALWLVCGVLALMIFAYRPLRYSIFLFLPAASLAGYAIESAIRGELRFNARYRWLSLVLTLGTLWYLTTQTYLLFVDDWRPVVFGGYVKWVTLIVSAAITYAVYLFLTRYRGTFRRLIILLPVAAFSLLTVYHQGELIKDGLVDSGDAIEQYSHELSMIVDSDAVLTGAYMPALTIENELRGVIYNFGLAKLEPDFLTKYGITHIVVNSKVWPTAVREFPMLDSAHLVTQLALREQIIELYRLPAAIVPPTAFEAGSLALRRNDWASALPHLRRFTAQHPASLLGNLQLAMALYAGEDYRGCVSTLERVDAMYPDDYMAHELAREFYTRIYRRTSMPAYKEKADYHAMRVRQLNPYAPTTGSE
jgi:hypothetical protein